MTLEELKIIKEVVDNTNLRGKIWYHKIGEASRILNREIKLKSEDPRTGKDLKFPNHSVMKNTETHDPYIGGVNTFLSEIKCDEDHEALIKECLMKRIAANCPSCDLPLVVQVGSVYLRVE